MKLVSIKALNLFKAIPNYNHVLCCYVRDLSNNKIEIIDGGAFLGLYELQTL